MIEFEGITKTFRRGERVVQALGDINLTIQKGEFVTVLGPSGCGKTTLLHILGGFETPTTGVVRVDGKPVTKPGRDRGMVFQEATLFPWRTIRDNVAWPMQVSGTPKAEACERADGFLATVGLSRFTRAYPGELSGGMRQRAALARTLAMEPSVLLMDEPFGALDAQTREVMQEDLLALWQDRGLTVLFITHDIAEAIFLGDRVIVMGAGPGRIVEDCRIDLDRPRTANSRNDQHILEYRSRMWDLLKQQPPRGFTSGAANA
ncbi:MAG: ABC transporter ATP-binding protein [Rhodobacteraceae bacterium]|nr:ABC transporter ATP-binding protein [Paracoccaceae bacterium]